MKTKFASMALAAALAFPAASFATSLPSSCAADYLGGVTPDVANPKLLSKVRELCYIQFGVFHSGITRTPLWSAEHLTADLVVAGESVERVDVFHPEGRLPADERSELADYRKSGYDRGHMSPEHDMATDAAQDESFTLANMVPQDLTLNRGAWSALEGTTRGFAKRYGDVYVVTGPVFSGSQIRRVGGRVFVPTFIYKAVYIPKSNQASVWWADNDTGSVEVISVAELTARTGIDPFPAATPAVKAQKVAFPVPNVKPKAPRDASVAAAQTDIGQVSSTGKEAKDSDGWIPGWLWRICAEIVRLVIHSILRG